MVNLKSSVQKKGKVTSQIVTFVGGIKKTIRGVVSETIEQGQFTKFDTLDGRMVMVNDHNVLCIEVFSHEENIKKK